MFGLTGSSSLALSHLRTYSDWLHGPSFLFGHEPLQPLPASLTQVELYRSYPSSKWYNMFGCDTYINVQNTLELLDAFDSSKDWWITTEIVERLCGVPAN